MLSCHFQGDIILRVHAEDGDKGVPREITYGLVSEGNPFIPFFNISETTGKGTISIDVCVANVVPQEIKEIKEVGRMRVISLSTHGNSLVLN